jgi:hypothetical protein
MRNFQENYRWKAVEYLDLTTKFLGWSKMDIEEVLSVYGSEGIIAVTSEAARGL